MIKKFREKLSKKQLLIFDILIINLVVQILLYFYARNIFYNNTMIYYGGYHFPFENVYIIEDGHFTGFFDVLIVSYSFFEFFWYGIFPIMFIIIWKKLMK